MYEHVSHPLLDRTAFLRRLAASAGLGLAALAVSLVVGMIGYRWLEDLSWIDAFLNAAMLMGGMGPMEHQRSDTGKLFEGIYALYCGLAVITVAGIMFAPVLHRFLHKFHLENK